MSKSSPTLTTQLPLPFHTGSVGSLVSAKASSGLVQVEPARPRINVGGGRYLALSASCWERTGTCALCSAQPPSDRGLDQLPLELP